MTLAHDGRKGFWKNFAQLLLRLAAVLRNVAGFRRGRRRSGWFGPAGGEAADAEKCENVRFLSEPACGFSGEIPPTHSRGFGSRLTGRKFVGVFVSLLTTLPAQGRLVHGNFLTVSHFRE